MRDLPQRGRGRRGTPCFPPRTLRLCGEIVLWVGLIAPAFAEKPSILLITIDTLRADHVNAALTPTLHQLEAESIVFENAVSVSPLTLPAHASLLTGLYPLSHGVRDNLIFSLSPAVATLPAALKKGGYATAAFVSAIVLNSRFGLNTGFDHYNDAIEGVERSAEQTLSRVRQWLERTPQPFFVWIHLFEPHAPYQGGYKEEVKRVDRELGKFFDYLRQKNLWDDTILTVTADHGESLGEHGEQTHGFFLYDATLRIPWILKVPGHRGRVFSHQVRIIDIMPTLLQFAGIPPGQDSSGERLEIQGSGLASALKHGSSPQLQAYSETYLPRHQFNWSELRSLRTDRFKYIQSPEAELYDLPQDPAEQKNRLAENSAMGAALKEALEKLESRYLRPAQRTATDSVMAEKFMSLGYVGYSSATTAVEGQKLPDPKAKLEVYVLTMDALELSETGKLPEALEKLRRAEALDPAVAQVHFIKGSILGNLGKFQEAVAALERTVELNPRYVTARFKLALAHLTLRNYNRAESVLQSVLQDEPKNFRAIHNLAAIAYARGDLAQAEQLEKQALAIDREYFEAWNTLGAIYVVRKETESALEALKTATRINPKSGQAFYNLALAARAAGHMAEAEAAAEKACSLDKRFCH